MYYIIDYSWIKLVQLNLDGKLNFNLLTANTLFVSKKTMG